MKKTYIITAACSLLAIGSALTSCSPKAEEAPAEKTKMMWIDFSANWERLSNVDSLQWIIDKCHEAGINALSLEVKGTAGEVPYASDLAPRCREWKGVERADDYDCLQLVIDRAHEKGMKVYAAFNIFCEGNGVFRRGPIFDSISNWQSHNYLPSGEIKPVTEIDGKLTLFLNPAYPEARAYETDILVECAKKYDVDGVMCDRTRYDNIQSDFSDYSRQAFEQYIGQEVENFPADIYEWKTDAEGKTTRVDGPLFKQWIEWRASNIYNFFVETRDKLKAARPDCELAAYTGAWYPSYFEVGANWASNQYDPSADYDWATPNYKNYGYAEVLDFYTNGNYYPTITIEELRSKGGQYRNETDSEVSRGEHLCVEGGCRLTDQLLCGGDFAGGLYVEDYGNDVQKFKDAVKMNLNKSKGLMVFDLVHVVTRDWWTPLAEAISEAE